MTEYEWLRAEIDKKSAIDPKLRALMKRIRAGRADFNDTAEYARICSDILGRKLSARVLELADREEVCTRLLRDGYDDINDICGTVQRSLDEKKGLHIAPQKADFPAERVRQIAHSLIDPTVGDEVIQRRADRAVANAAMSFHDDYIKENARFRNDAGLKCCITRIASSNCCKWCSDLAGRYKYPHETPDDVFHRHDNCSCTVTYENGRERQDVWTKRTWEAPAADAGSEPPTVFSQEEAARLQNERLAEYRGLTSGSGSGIISGRESGSGSSVSDGHTYEKIGEIDFTDKKAVAQILAEFEQKYSDSSIEHCRVICPNGEVYEVHGDKYTVDTSLLGDKLKGSINEHNHVTGESQYSFSWDDVESSINDGSSIVVAFDEKYRYSMKLSEMDANVDYYEAVDKAIETVFDRNISGADISSDNLQHEMVKEACKMLGIQYERVSL